MSFQNHSFQVSKTAHFSTYGNLSKQTKYVWLGCHGYGQLASQFIRKFEFLDPDDHYIMAPEGLSRFYWHTNQQPVSSWMTKADRYDEINDYVEYIDKLYRLKTCHINRDVKLILFGFSQGCATLWRWIHARQPHFNVLVNWAGWIPEDISYRHLSSYLKNKHLFLTYGDTDHFISPEMAANIAEVIRGNALNMDVSVFDGGHKIPGETLRKFYTDVIRPCVDGE